MVVSADSSMLILSAMEAATQRARAEVPARALDGHPFGAAGRRGGELIAAAPSARASGRSRVCAGSGARSCRARGRRARRLAGGRRDARGWRRLHRPRRRTALLCVTGPFALPGLILHDMRVVLEDLRGGTSGRARVAGSAAMNLLPLGRVGGFAGGRTALRRRRDSRTPRVRVRARPRRDESARRRATPGGERLLSLAPSSFAEYGRPGNGRSLTHSGRCSNRLSPSAFSRGHWPRRGLRRALCRAQHQLLGRARRPQAGARTERSRPRRIGERDRR